MLTIEGRNVNEIYPVALEAMSEIGEISDSRNGRVYRAPYPVTTVYTNPRERVLFLQERDANPFFHFYEGLWMLSGSNEVEKLTPFVKRMAEFSDDGKTLNGAYGHRWRLAFGLDQIDTIIGMLSSDSTTRRCVLSMFDPWKDLGRKTNDVPCNTQIYFSARGDELDMTVCCRSNDIIWGAYGANAVHFSMLHEYVANFSNFEVGVMYQISNDWHAYEKIFDEQRGSVDAEFSVDPYELGRVKPFPMIDADRIIWNEDLSIFINDGPIIGFRSRFFRKVATPIYRAHQHFKQRRDVDGAREIVSQCEASDWRVACDEWLQRRDKR